MNMDGLKSSIVDGTGWLAQDPVPISVTHSCRSCTEEEEEACHSGKKHARFCSEVKCLSAIVIKISCPHFQKNHVILSLLLENIFMYERIKINI